MKLLGQHKRHRMIVLIDWENLQRSAGIPSCDFNLEKALDDRLKTIAEDIGEIVGVFVFMPPHLTHLISPKMRELGFYTIACPKMRDKKGLDIDTTDQTLMEFGNTWINLIPGLTHLCVASGDVDFSPLLRSAHRKRLKVIIVATDFKSLSSRIIPLADRQKPDSDKMIYTLLPGAR